MSTRYVPIGGKEEKESEGFIGFLGKLEWIRDAELENMVPFDTEKLRTPHIIYIFTQGAQLALTLHSVAVLIFLSLAILSVFFPLLFYFLPLVEIYMIGIKLGIPVWLVHKFVTFQRGLSTEMIKHYLIGYCFVSFFIDILSLGISFIITLIANALYGTDIPFYDEFIYPFLSIFFNIKTLAVILFNILTDPLPLIYFFFFRKKRKEKFPKWMPLDTIPEDKG